MIDGAIEASLTDAVTGDVRVPRDIEAHDLLVATAM